MKRSSLTGILLIILSFYSCNNVKNTDNKISVQTKEIVLPASLVWMNSEIRVEMGKRIIITSDERALGIPEVFNEDAVKIFGHGGLIGRIGENGYPFAIGKGRELIGNSHNHGEFLYLGRNEGADAVSYGIQYSPEELSVKIEIREDNAPGPISPRDGAWSSDTLPTFDWDDVDDAMVYTVELSNFPDFRLIEQSVTTPVSYAQTTSEVTVPIPGQQQPQQPPTFQPLSEGLHYWRVRAEFNAGRSLSPDLDWTKWSPVQVYGVELGTAPSSPVVLSPQGEIKISPDSSLAVEFIQSPDPSGVVWRYWLKQAECGQTPQIDPTQDKPAVNWRVFSGTYEVYDPNTPPQLYSSLNTGALAKGNWLLRIEVRDGSDPNGANSSFTELNINAGCE